MMNDFDKILKQKLEGYTEVPPESVFENVCKNIPKRTFMDVVSAHKYLFISAIVAIATATVLFVTYHPESQETELTSNTIIDNTTPDAPKGNPETISITRNDKETDSSTPSNTNGQELIIESKNPENKIDLLNLNDTVICGNELLIEGIDEAKIKLSKGLNLTKVASGVKLSSNTYGTHTIDILGNGSVKITFVETEKLSAIASKTELCYGEKLIVNVSSESTNITWNENGFVASKINENKYEIAGLHTGKNNIILSTNGQCASKVAFDVSVSEKLKYSISTKENYCTNNNGQINVKTSVPTNYYKINGTKISHDGIFTNLKSGIYTLEINYANNCSEYDTILIKDKINVFTSVLHLNNIQRMK